ncbi:MAG: methyltransferase [Gallionellaceae bacterium]|nr:methyltransferase [Gallionellaceae bacterium]
MHRSHKLLECITSSWKAQALHAAAELGIADLLADGPKTSDELAAACGAHAPSLYRLLLALTTLDICTEGPDGAFELTPTGEMLRSDAPDSLRAWTIWWGEYLWPVWGNLLHSVRTGTSARKLLTGDSGFGHLERDAVAAAIFNQGLVELTRLAAASVIRHYDFSSCQRIVDVGGGYGELLLAILKANPGVCGSLFDLPHAVAGAQRRISEAGLGDRCDVQAGDFFEQVPAGADAYVLKSVIHDWEDENSLRILANCRRAVGGSGRLLLVEQILPDRLSHDARHQSLMRSDLTMLVAHAARERTESEYRRLLDGAGFRVTRVIATDSTFSVIEAVAA